MGFLRKDKAPNELPDLALSDSLGFATMPTDISNSVKDGGVAGEDFLEVAYSEEGAGHENIKKDIDNQIKSNITQVGFFDKILEDLNGEIGDFGKLEEWYEKKFLPQNAVSDMKGYWEGNKADILIQSFGAEYKKKINDKIKVLQELEEDWREIYFKLIKKEEDMKKEERELKETLAEFVNLCKRRRNGEYEK